MSLTGDHVSRVRAFVAAFAHEALHRNVPMAPIRGKSHVSARGMDEAFVDWQRFLNDYLAAGGPRVAENRFVSYKAGEASETRPAPRSAGPHLRPARID